jgi:hypothetical protein
VSSGERFLNFDRSLRPRHEVNQAFNPKLE